MQLLLGISQSASLSALHRSDVRIIIIGMSTAVKSKNEFRELANQNQGTGIEVEAWSPIADSGLPRNFFGWEGFGFCGEVFAQRC
jgi:hypothetical protein